MESNNTITIRADGSAGIGSGHIMRCYALAEAIFDLGGHCVLVCGQLTPTLERALLDCEFIRVEKIDNASHNDANTTKDIGETLSIMRSVNSSTIVIDGYHFLPEFMNAMKSAGMRVLLMDDINDRSMYPCDFLLNQNAHADALDYEGKADDGTRMLLGPKFALLRKRFKALREQARNTGTSVRGIALCMGGGDVSAALILVIRSLCKISSRPPHLTILPGMSDKDSLREAASLYDGDWEIIEHDGPELADYLMRADIAIIAGGITVWEAACLGVPSVVISTADNQIPSARKMNQYGAIKYLGSVEDLSLEGIAVELDFLIDSSEHRTELARRSRQIVDGKGAARVASILMAPNGAQADQFAVNAT